MPDPTAVRAAPKAKRVLVVDDEKNIRLTLHQVLEEEGLHVETAGDGKEALQQIRTQPGFDLVLMDLRMPGLGGMKTLPKLRELDAEVPVVVFTAHGNAENATEAMKRGATDFAEKPFSPTQIRTLVRALDAPPGAAGASAAGEAATTARHTHRTLLFLEEAADAEALLALAAAPAQSYGGEVVAVSPIADLDALVASAQPGLGVFVRTRAVDGAGTPREALSAAVEEETPEHVLLAWSGPAANAHAHSAFAQQLAAEAGCEVTLARPGLGAATQRIAAVVSRAPHTLVAVRRALELAKSAGVASLTLLSAQTVPPEDDEERLSRDGRALIRQVARKAGLSEGQYRAHVTVSTDDRALARAAEDFDTLCVSAAHADELVPALFDEKSRLRGTVALVRGPDHQEPTILESLVSRLSGA